MLAKERFPVSELQRDLNFQPEITSNAERALLEQERSLGRG
jgi:hypothetical protein